MKLDFDKAAKDWDSDETKKKRASDVAKDILRFISDTGEMSAMEYGCGTGLLGFSLLPHFKNMTFCDSSQGMMSEVEGKIKKSGYKNCNTILIDIEKPLDTSIKYDCIFNLMVLHHIPDAEEIIKKWAESLNEGGYLCIADLEEEDGSFHGDDFNGHKGFNKGELTEIFKKNNFNFITTSEPHVVKKKMPDGRISEYPLFLMIGKKK